MTKPTEQGNSDYLAPGRAANALGISVRTLARLADDGHVGCIRVLGGHRRYRRRDIETLQQASAS